MRFSLFRRHFISLAFMVTGQGLCMPPLAAQTTTLARVAPGHKASTAARPAASKVVLVLGDSLSAEYGLQRGQGWVTLLQQRLKDQRLAYSVVNASISGDTTSGGLSRLPQLVKTHAPAVVVIELGGNDALRGLPLKETEANLLRMTEMAQAGGAKVLLLGMQVPPNYGADYNARFAQAYVHVAKARKTALVPFFLAGVADGPNAAQLFQADRIHPTAQAHPALLDTAWSELARLLK